ncbi:MAG: efflux RND transporter periplasmic adaptor subunit [Syntrophaceae bacterium]|nr:efflux RND transporter periplasmic adaptor subunit [Syntrophaceae bacterium]
MKASLPASWVILTSLALLFVTNSCEKADPKTAVEEKTYNVQVRTAEKKVLRPFVEAIGTLYPNDEVTVSTEVDGVLSNLKAEEGTRVSQGMLLAQIDDADYLLEVKRAEATVEAADSRFQQLVTGARPQEVQLAKAEVDQTLADLEKRKADRERAKKLYEGKYISAQEWDSARTAFEVAVATHQKAKENYALVTEGPRKEEIAAARAQLEQAQAALALARQKLGKTKVFSPLAGVVRVKRVSKGEFVKNGSPLFTIIQSDPLKLRFNLPEKEVGKVKPRQEVSLRVDAFPGREFKGIVSTIYPSLEEKTRTLMVEALVPNPDENLKAGLFAKVILYTGAAKETVVVPITALLYEEATIKVFVDEGGRAKERTVGVGGKYGEVMEITEGLAGGEKVVVAGQQNLSEGVKVHVAR